MLEHTLLCGNHGLVGELLVPDDRAGVGMVGAVSIVQSQPHPSLGISWLSSRSRRCDLRDALTVITCVSREDTIVFAEADQESTGGDGDQATPLPIKVPVDPAEIVADGDLPREVDHGRGQSSRN